MHPLKQRFLEKGYSVTHYAAKVGCDKAMLSRLLNGKEKLKAKRANSKLAKLLNALKEDGILKENA